MTTVDTKPYWADLSSNRHTEADLSRLAQDQGRAFLPTALLCPDDSLLAALALPYTEFEGSIYWRSACGRCGGSGIFRPFGTCFTCNGHGKKRVHSVKVAAFIKTVRRRMEKLLREQSQRDIEARAKDKQHEEWLMRMDQGLRAFVCEAEEGTFPWSMLQAAKRWGDLTAGQWAALRTCYAREQADPEVVGEPLVLESGRHELSVEILSIRERHSDWGAVYKGFCKVEADGKVAYAWMTVGDKEIGTPYAGKVTLKRAPDDRDGLPFYWGSRPALKEVTV